MSNNIPVLMLRGSDGKFFPVAGITGGGGGTGGSLTAENISYTLSEDIQNEFPELAVLESDTVKSGLDLAMYYAFAGLLAKNIAYDVPTATGTVQISLQNLFENSIIPAMEKAHEHDNKSVLDGLSDSNGVLKYNNNPITPQKVSEGTYITLADNTEYRLTDVTTLNLSYPTGDFECWMRLSCAASDKVTVTLPAGTKYIGAAPDFKNGETWELSFKDKVLVAQKVGDGSMTPIETVEDGTEVSY